MMASRFSAIKKSIFNSFIPGVLWWIFVLVLMCTPGKDLPRLGSWTELISLDKIIHVLVFGLMVYLFSRPLYQKNLSNREKKQLFAKIAIASAIWGLTIEFIQHFWIPGRSLDILDFVADSLGCLLAYIYCKRYLLS
jgi:hypothetical protein